MSTLFCLSLRSIRSNHFSAVTSVFVVKRVVFRPRKFLERLAQSIRFACRRDCLQALPDPMETMQNFLDPPS